mmetsp:Transcript_21233/g.46850  ORF Transcript_21233/g.46850 Transcript_21233/m.46850 type:complete len:272 (-) Transcript_21233:127-942(-)
MAATFLGALGGGIASTALQGQALALMFLLLSLLSGIVWMLHKEKQEPEWPGTSASKRRKARPAPSSQKKKKKSDKSQKRARKAALSICSGSSTADEAMVGSGHPQDCDWNAGQAPHEALPHAAGSPELSPRQGSREIVVVEVGAAPVDHEQAASDNLDVPEGSREAGADAGNDSRDWPLHCVCEVDGAPVASDRQTGGNTESPCCPSDPHALADLGVLPDHYTREVLLAHRRASSTMMYGPPGLELPAWLLAGPPGIFVPTQLRALPLARL